MVLKYLYFIHSHKKCQSVLSPRGVFCFVYRELERFCEANRYLPQPSRGLRGWRAASDRHRIIAPVCRISAVEDPDAKPEILRASMRRGHSAGMSCWIFIYYSHFYTEGNGRSCALTSQNLSDILIFVWASFGYSIKLSFYAVGFEMIHEGAVLWRFAIYWIGSVRCAGNNATH